MKSEIRIIYNQPEVSVKLPIFAQEKYLRNKGAKYGWFLSNDFVLPFILDKKLIFKRLFFTYAPIPLNKELDKVSQKQFIDQVVGFVKQKKLCDAITKAQAYVVFDEVPDKCDSVEWGSYITDIPENENELLMKFHSKHRNVIKKAIKDGVTILQENQTSRVFENIKETLERQNSIYYPSSKYLNGLKKDAPKNIALFVAEKDGILQGSAVIIYDEDCGYYMYGGSCNRPSTGSINLLQYEVMKFLLQRKIFKYDFVGARINVKVGSKYEGIQRFKMRFGAELKKGYAFRVVFNPIKYSVFNKLIKVYGKIKGFRFKEPIDQLLKDNY